MILTPCPRSGSAGRRLDPRPLDLPESPGPVRRTGLGPRGRPAGRARRGRRRGELEAPRLSTSCCAGPNTARRGSCGRCSEHGQIPAAAAGPGCRVAARTRAATAPAGHRGGRPRAALPATGPAEEAEMSRRHRGQDDERAGGQGDPAGNLRPVRRKRRRGGDRGRRGSWRQALAEDGWSRHLTTLEGWRKFTAAEARPPELPDARRWEAMGEAEQELFDEYRLDNHTRLAAAATSTLRQVVTTGRRLTLLNRHAVSARRGMILSGERGRGRPPRSPSSAKPRPPTAPPPRDQRPIPVIYVTVPPGRDPADARCRVRPVPRPAADCPGEHHRRDRGRLRRRGRCPGSVVCVDEIHNLQLATRSGAEVSDTLKYFSERIPATFVYAGISRA